ncbi:hypothetical protein JCM5353_005983 [Sporobolomyces roseus]
MAELDPPPPPPPRLSKRSISDALLSLDNATLSSSLSPSSTTSTTSKRPRTIPTSTRALEQILSSRSNLTQTSPSSLSAPPSYNPTSLPLLLSRLSTYKLSTYSPSKPTTLSSLSCALHGWINSGRERLTCITCDHSLILLNPTTGGWNGANGRALMEEYDKLVLKGKAHKDNCPWKLRPCSKNGVYKLEGGGLGVSRGGRRKLLEIVGEEAKGMDENGLGGIELELGNKVGELLDENKLKRNVIALLPSPPPPQEDSTEQAPPVLSTTSILLSIFGWTLSPLPLPSSSLSRSSSKSSLSSLKSIPQILSCHYCLRQILVTPYLSSGEGKKSLNPLNQHHHYCPYIDTTIDTPSTTTTTTTSNLIKKAGWQLRLEAVLGLHSNNATYDIMTLKRTNSNTSIASTSQGGETSEVDNGKSSTLKTRELLSYVRGLLGPKVNRKI